MCAHINKIKIKKKKKPAPGRTASGRTEFGFSCAPAGSSLCYKYL
jgi:hypothetical protein